ncbi:MAG: hypothetical protein QF599_10335 [Planctomycetota bacterium]|jgi:hypothetical protein|nr:hypothetical protein [Planctomycetota bacterium]MDP6956364.1 hypothetical protein [Planctomycetota bacterium]
MEARVLEAIFPGTTDVPGLCRERALPFLAMFHDQSPRTLRLALHASAIAFVMATPLTVGALRPALLLAPEVLARHTEACAGHRVYLLRQALLMLKTAGGFCWGADQAVRSSMSVAGYKPDPLKAGCAPATSEESGP